MWSNDETNLYGVRQQLPGPWALPTPDYLPTPAEHQAPGSGAPFDACRGLLPVALHYPGRRSDVPPNQIDDKEKNHCRDYSQL